MTLLQLRGFTVSLLGRDIVHSLALDIGEGEFVGLVGPNGAGKSTLMRAVLGLVPSRGDVTIAGEDMRVLTPARRARAFAYVPQNHEIAWPIPVRSVVALGRPHGRGREQSREVEEAMAAMEVTALAGRPATELSGGEQARVLVARALAQGAPLTLADEPAAGLDPYHQIALMEVLQRHCLAGGSVIASLHDLTLAARWCSRVVILDEGRIVADGTPVEVLTREVIGDVYGVESHIGVIDAAPYIVPLRRSRLTP